MDQGFIKLSRRFFSNVMWKEARTFSSCEAWLDLIQSARFDATPRKECIGGREVSYKRGEYPASIRFLAKRWQWSEKKVRGFLNYLKKEQMITIEQGQGMNIITLCKYDEYNPIEISKGTGKGTIEGTDIELKINILKEERAQLRAQLKAQRGIHPPEEGHSEGTNTKKEEERYITNNNLNLKKENSPNGELKKENLSSPPTSERIAYNKLMDYYNTVFKDKLSQIKSMTETRKTAVRARMAQYGKESIVTVFNLVLQSPFLLGANDRNWRCDFDWIFKQNNFTRILEGRYNGKRTDTAATRRESVSRLKDLAGAILQDASPENG